MEKSEPPQALSGLRRPLGLGGRKLAEIDRRSRLFRRLRNLRDFGYGRILETSGLFGFGFRLGYGKVEILEAAFRDVRFRGLAFFGSGLLGERRLRTFRRLFRKLVGGKSFLRRGTGFRFGASQKR
jgi:hypothetical protein